MKKPVIKKRKSIWIIVFILIIIIGSLTYCLIKNSNQKESPNQGNFSNQDILNIVQQKIDDYCKTLEDNVIHSACPTCSSFKNEQNETYVYVDSLSEETNNIHKYTIEKDGSNYNITINLHLIYGRNDRPGEVLISFIVNEEGKIISKSLPIKECV